MARDPLLMLSLVRLHAVEQARQALGICLAAEAGVVDRIRGHAEAARRDLEACGTLPDFYRFLDMSAARQDIIRTDQHADEATLVALRTRSDEARAAVVAARTEAEAVRQLIGERAALAQTEAAKQEQHTLDDMTRRRRPANGRP